MFCGLDHFSTSQFFLGMFSHLFPCGVQGGGGGSFDDLAPVLHTEDLIPHTNFSNLPFAFLVRRWENLEGGTEPSHSFGINSHSGRFIHFGHEMVFDWKEASRSINQIISAAVVESHASPVQPQEHTAHSL